MFNAPMIDGGSTANSPELVSAAIARLKPQEIDALSRYVYDLDTQATIADESGVPRRTVSYRLSRARKKLARDGITVHLPGKGRRPASVRRFDPAAMDGLTVDRGEDGRTVARWQSRDDR